MAMSASDLKKWAREEILDAIDELIKEKEEYGNLGTHVDWDDLTALKKERNRIAKFLDLPEKDQQ